MESEPMEDKSYSEPYSELVCRAQEGDLNAFGELVERFQDMAVGYAWARVGDLGDAVDATQEAFLDGLRKIELLREPAAFPGWLQALVATHCSRIHRRRAERRPPATGEAGTPGVDQEVVDRHQAERVRRLVEQLPPHERVVVAMHYLGDCTYGEIAELIGISTEAAKKRAHSARARLRDRWEGTNMGPRDALRPMRPSRDRRFADSTLLFAAIAQRDVALARRLLEADASLVDSEEDWDPETARRAGLLPARHASPLLRAVGRGSRELVELLIAHGADVNATCGCAGGESPLWAATVAGDGELVRLLLDHGADPNPSAFRGATPLHVAAMRGYDPIARMLTDAGADPDIADEFGRTPRDWAALKRHHLTGETPAPGGVAGTDAPPRPLESGIKAINLFAPLHRGSLVRWVGPPGTGSLVVLVELVHNVARFEDREVNIIGFELEGLTEAEIDHAFAELDPAVRPRVHLGSADLPADARRRVFTDAVALLHGAQLGHRRPVLVVAAHPAHASDVEAEIPRLLEAGALVILFDFTGSATAETDLPVDATITLDGTLADAGLYPAVDPARTVGYHQDDGHARIAGEARELLARYAAVDPGRSLRVAEGGETWHETARNLHRGLTQPFHTTEPFTGRPGATVSLPDTVRFIRTVLTGRWPDGADEHTLRPRSGEPA